MTPPKLFGRRIQSPGEPDPPDTEASPKTDVGLPRTIDASILQGYAGIGLEVLRYIAGREDHAVVNDAGIYRRVDEGDRHKPDGLVAAVYHAMSIHAPDELTPIERYNLFRSVTLGDDDRNHDDYWRFLKTVRETADSLLIDGKLEVVGFPIWEIEGAADDLKNENQDRWDFEFNVRIHPDYIRTPTYDNDIITAALRNMIKTPGGDVILTMANTAIPSLLTLEEITGEKHGDLRTWIHNKLAVAYGSYMTRAQDRKRANQTPARALHFARQAISTMRQLDPDRADELQADYDNQTR